MPSLTRREQLERDLAEARARLDRAEEEVGVRERKAEQALEALDLAQGHRAAAAARVIALEAALAARPASQGRVLENALPRSEKDGDRD